MNCKHIPKTILLAALVSLGCGKDSPSKVAVQFYAAIEKGDAESYGKIMTPKTAQTVAKFEEIIRPLFADKGGIASAKETIDGDRAVVEITFKDGSTDRLDLVKVKGKWKVTIDKK